MITFELAEVYGWEAAFRGMRNPMDSWYNTDTKYRTPNTPTYVLASGNYGAPEMGPRDYKLAMQLRNAGTDHRKYLRMINVTVDITAPLYWWKEFDTYKVGTVANSCSTMHKITAKEFTIEDFSCEHLIGAKKEWVDKEEMYSDENFDELWSAYDALDQVVRILNFYRQKYLETKDKKYWWQMIQLLPSSYYQLRTVQMNYEVLANIYHSRREHKLDEWRLFCRWIERLPYPELITGATPKDNTNVSVDLEVQ